MIAILFHRFGVLAVGGTDTANRRDAQANQVTVWLRAVALEVAVQAALALGHSQRVIGQGKVVHANIHIARRQKSRQ